MRRTCLIIVCLIFSGGLLGAHGPGNDARFSAVLSLLRSREPGIRWNEHKVLSADFDYDGTIDYAVSGVRGKQFIVGIVKGSVSRRSKHWTLKFAEDAGSQGSLCSLADAKIEVETLDETEVEGTRKLPKNSKGINLSDGACDSFHIYWSDKDQQFTWSRL